MSHNDITGDKIATKAPTEAYRDGHERIFGKREPVKGGAEMPLNSEVALRVEGDWGGAQIGEPAPVVGEVSICKKCGAEFAKVCRPCHAAACAAWRLKNADNVRAYKKLWAAKNMEAIAAHSSAWRAKNRDAIAQLNESSLSEISDGYAAALLGLPVAAIPKSLIDLKREHLKITRQLKEMK